MMFVDTSRCGIDIHAKKACVHEFLREHIYSDEKKRKLYDKYGSFGIYLADQVGSRNQI